MIPTTLRLGSRSTDVARWQVIAGVVADGDFGPKTAAATRLWQQKRGLTPDGIVGPATWSVALATEKPMYPATSDLDDNFFPRLLDVCKAIGCAPEDLLAVFMSESGLKATAYNPHGGAAGIFQIMPGTLKGMGFAGTSKDFATLSATEQLGWAERFYLALPSGRPWVSAGKLYLANFLPARVGIGTSPEAFVCGTKDGKSVLQWAYDDNRGFDTERKGWISLGNMSAAAKRAAKGARWNELLSRLAAVRGGDAA